MTATADKLEWVPARVRGVPCGAPRLAARSFLWERDGQRDLCCFCGNPRDVHNSVDPQVLSDRMEEDAARSRVIVDLLRARGTTPVEDIPRLLRQPATTVIPAVGRAADRGLIRRVEPGIYAPR